MRSRQLPPNASILTRRFADSLAAVVGPRPLINLYGVVPPRSDEAMPDPDRILRLRTVLDRTGLSRSTLYRKISDGSFPRQIRISIHGAGWRESDVNRWVANPPAYQLDNGVSL